jgi:hypothetical protein
VAVRWLSYLLCTVTAFSLPARVQGAAAPSEPLEYQVKAAFLLNFTKFIEWPRLESEALDSPSAICILGEDPFGSTLDQMVEGETLLGHRITVQRVRRPSPSSCRVLFVSRSEKDVEGLLAAVRPGVLTVGEAPDFLHDGGMIDFVVEKGRVRFDINEGAAARAGLKLNSRLLNVARSVER